MQWRTPEGSPQKHGVAETPYRTVPPPLIESNSSEMHAINNPSNATLSMPSALYNSTVKSASLHPRSSKPPAASQSRWGWIRSGRGKLQGWRAGLIACTISTGLILFINTILLLIALARLDHSTNTRVFLSGDCDAIKSKGLFLHLLINSLSTILLGCSSYTMQCLSSPTRQEVDRAHDRRISLNIGVPSLKNLCYIKKEKAVLWFLLCLSTLPLHLLWNSVIITTTSANEFVYLVVDEGFLSGQPYMEPLGDSGSISSNREHVAAIRASYHAGNFRGPYNVADCISMYGEQILSRRRNLLAVTLPVNGRTRMSPISAFTHVRASSDDSGSSVPTFPAQSLWNGSSLIAFEREGINIATDSTTEWLCNGYDELVWVPFVGCDAALAKRYSAMNGTWYLRPLDPYFQDQRLAATYPIEYCLSEESIVQHCTIQYIPALLGVVVLCNFIKLFCMSRTMWTLSNRNISIFATVGDAVVSFLKKPDSHTQNMSLTSLSNYKTMMKSGLSQRGLPLLLTYKSSKIWKRTLFSTTSRTRWLTTVGICGLYLAFGIHLLRSAIQELDFIYPSMHEIWNLGFGKPHPDVVISHRGQSNFNIFRNIITANAFQLALSTTYFLYNSLLTAQCCALEWSTHATKHQPLRVTVPEGDQQSAWFLHLPYKYGVPLTVCLTVLHFLISQSIFVLDIQWYGPDGSKDPHNRISAVGYSPLAILCSVSLGAALILAQCLYSLRPIDSRMPIHGNNSWVISAACHPLVPSNKDRTDSNGPEATKATARNDSPHLAPSRDKGSIATKPLKWGAVRQARENGDIRDRIGHCSLTAEPVEMPVTGLKYA